MFLLFEKLSNRFSLCLLLGLFLIALTRLPQIYHNTAILDSDEAILGLMIKHFADGKGLPIFFYGQGYGLSFFEAATGALFFYLFGTSISTLKTAMLFLWGTGWVFFTLSVRQFTDNKAACIGAFLLIICPAWSAWSMMARSGYITGFTLTNLSLLIVAHLYRANKSKKALYAFLGICMGLVFLAQPIFFFPFCPFIALLLYKERKIVDAAILIFSTLATIALLIIVGKPSAYHTPTGLLHNTDILESLYELPKRIWVFFSGIYFFTQHDLKRGPFTAISAYLWCFLLLFSLFRLLYRLLIERKYRSVRTACLLALLLVIAVTLVVNTKTFGFRYFLPLAGILIFFLSFEFSHISNQTRNSKAITTITVIMVIISGMLSSIEARFHSRFGTIEYRSSFQNARDDLIEDLLSNEIKHVYCLHPTFQWNIIFASQEQIIARWKHPIDRYPPYPKAVDLALRSGEKVAIVGMTYQLKEIKKSLKMTGQSDSQIRKAGEHFFWIAEPGIALIRQSGFKLNEPVKSVP
jgi:hypothetical protein